MYCTFLPRLTVAGAQIEHPFADGGGGRLAGGNGHAVEHIARVPDRTHERRSLPDFRVVRRHLSVVGHWAA